MLRLLALVSVAQHRTTLQERQMPDHVLDWRLGGLHGW